MAISQKPGKDNSGKYRYRQDTAGNLIDEQDKPIIESYRSPAIDHDLDEIAEAFVAWGYNEGFSFCQED